MKSRKSLGTTDKIGVSLVALLAVTVGMSFILASWSIKAQYVGSLICWTACIAPLDTCLGIVLKAIVNKNKEENTGADGEGIRYRQLANEMEGATI